MKIDRRRRVYNTIPMEETPTQKVGIVLLFVVGYGREGNAVDVGLKVVWNGGRSDSGSKRKGLGMN